MLVVAAFKQVIGSYKILSLEIRSFQSFFALPYFLQRVYSKKRHGDY